jgi:hypothetical protein
MTTTHHIGNYMYGDGEYIVEFSNVDSMGAPMKAAILTPSGRIYNAEYGFGEKAGRELAAATIDQVRAREGEAS